MKNGEKYSTYSQVLVVGAGPVGLLLGCQLARHGIDVRIIDKKSGVTATGARARGLSPRSLEVLEDLGVVDEIYRRGRANPKFRLYNRDALVSEVDPADNPVNHPTVGSPHRMAGMELPQQSTEEILAARLAWLGVRPELDRALTGLIQHSDHVAATLHTGEVVRAGYVIGCDGASSVVRREAGIPFAGRTWDEEHYINGCVALEGLDSDYFHIWPDTTSGMVFFSWQPDFERWAFFAAVPVDDHGQLPPPTAQTLRRVFDERCGLSGVAFGDTSLTSLWRPNIRMAQRFRQGRILLAGDAAHVHSPAGGQGLNTGLQDAHNLGWKLARVVNGAGDALLDSYEAERFPIAQRLLATSSRRHHAYHQTSDGQARHAALRDTILAHDTFSDTTQLSLSYRDGGLSRDYSADTGVAGLQAGDRAPDARCATDGSTVRLFDVLGGTHFTLLVFDQEPPSDPPVAPDLRVVTISPADAGQCEHVLFDHAGHARRAYGISGSAAVLVRPDGYIGLIDSHIDARRVADYLAS